MLPSQKNPAHSNFMKKQKIYMYIKWEEILIKICVNAGLLFVCRYTSESSVSLNRSPGQPSSYRSDEELMAVLDNLRGGTVDGWGPSAHLRSDCSFLSVVTGFCIFSYLPSIRVSGDPLSKLPVPHKLAILATMDEVSLPNVTPPRKSLNFIFWAKL